MYRAPQVTGKIVADVGCNKGYGAKILSQFAHKVVGIDVDIANIVVAKGKESGKNLDIENWQRCASWVLLWLLTTKAPASLEYPKLTKGA